MSIMKHRAPSETRSQATLSAVRDAVALPVSVASALDNMKCVKVRVQPLVADHDDADAGRSSVAQPAPATRSAIPILLSVFDENAGLKDLQA